MNILKISLYILISGLFALSCADVKESDINPEESFNKIYNHQSPDDNIYPVSIIQTKDKGYLVVSEADERSVRLLKIDARGDVRGDAVFSNLKSPLPGIFEVEEILYFFCRDELNYSISVKINPDSLSKTQLEKNLLISNPLSIGKTPQGFILQSWNPVDRKTVISLINESFIVTASNSFDIQEDVEPFLANHFFRKGKRLPFLCGQIDNNLSYFNGYHNYNFNLVFLNPSLEINGEIAGIKTEKYVTSIHNIHTNKFAVTTAATAEDKNYISSNTELGVRNPQGIVSDISADFIPEMSLEIPLSFKKITANGAEHLLCGFTTKTNQIALYSYNLESGKLNGKHLLGYTNPYDFCSFEQTADGGLVVLSRTQVAGRFPRICVTKLSKSEVNNLFGKS